MDNQNKIYRIQKIHKLIEKQTTGTPLEFAKTVGVCRSHLYNLIDYLRINGAQVNYSRKQKSFYYEENFTLKIDTITILI
ncbi:MAG: hypothetical protein LBB41_04195 [Prevotellaceae bacterium]|nr:hypothetical protein [Prevotellaceae bacterium]